MQSSKPKTGKRMPRASASIPEDIREELVRIAERKKVSFAWVVREALEKYVRAETPLFNRNT